MTEQLATAVIGGSGLYTMKGLIDTSEHEIDTPPPESIATKGAPENPSVV